MIRFQCQNCGAKLTAKDERVGQTAPCPQCKTPITIEPLMEAVVIEEPLMEAVVIETTPEISPPPLPQIVQRQTQPHTTQQSQPWMIPVIILSTIICFPVGIVLIWIQSAWTQNQKIYWTAGIIGIPMLIALISPAIQTTRDIGSQTSRDIGSQAANVDVSNLTLDETFHPFEVGRKRRKHFECNDEYERLFGSEDEEYLYEEGGVIRKNSLHPSASPDIHNYEYYRIKDGFIDLGRPLESSKRVDLDDPRIIWGHKLKIGAKVGDSWDGQERCTWTLKRFIVDDKRVIAVVELEIQQSSGPPKKVTWEYEQGIGPIGHRSHTVHPNGDKEITWSDFDDSEYYDLEPK